MYIVFDIGGTKTRVGISEDAKTLERTVICRTPRSFTQGLSMLENAVRTLTGDRHITAIGGGIAGALTSKASTLAFSPNLPEWAEKPLRARLQDILHAPVLLENDAALAGLGEAVHGAGKGDAIVAYLTAGTGIGGARIVHGEIDQRAAGFEPGHQIVWADDTKVRDLESFASGSALEKKYGTEAFADPAHPLWKEAARMLACGVYNTILYWSPTSVVLGGSLFRHEGMLDLITEHLSGLPSVLPVMPDIKCGTLGDISGLYGALVLIRGTYDLH